MEEGIQLGCVGFAGVVPHGLFNGEVLDDGSLALPVGPAAGGVKVGVGSACGGVGPD